MKKNCIVRCHCESCLFGSNCTEKLSQADNVTLGLIPELNLENAEPTVLGSNIVDFKVAETFCPEIVPDSNPDDTPEDIDPYDSLPIDYPYIDPGLDNDPSDISPLS